MKTNRMTLSRLVIVSLVLLAACNQAPPSTPGDGDPLRALLHGQVESAYLEPFKASTDMVTYDGSQELEDFDMLIFDGDAHTPSAVSEDELIREALRAGKSVLALDVTEAHKKDGLGEMLHASTCGTSVAYAVRTGYDANGRFQAYVIEPSRSEAQPKRSGSPTGRKDTAQPAPEPTRPAGQSCGGGANVTVQSLGADSGAASAFAKTLLEALAEPTALEAQQSGPPTIPSDLIYATYYFTETFSTPLSGSLRGYPGTQTPNYTVNRTFTVYLNNKNNPQGDFQWVLLEQDAAANPKLSSENFIAMGTKSDTDWVIGSYDEAGWAQNQMQLSLWANSTDWSLVSTSPDTVNGTTSVTTGVSFIVQFGANPLGPSGSGSFTYSNSQTRDISDWAVENLATNTETQWMYETKNPVDGDYIPNCTAAIRTTGCYLGQLPNDLARDALKLYTQSVWRTPSVIDDTVGFTYWTFYRMQDVGCNNNGGAICAATNGNDGLYTNQDYQPLNTQGLSFDLGVVVPIPIASITFSPNPAEGGNAVTGTVTLARPAKIDTPISLSSNSQNATMLPSVTVKQGQTSATFQVLTNTNGIAIGGSSVATIQAFYAQNYQAQLTVQNINNASLTLEPASVEPGQPSVGKVNLTGPVAVDTVLGLSSNSPNATVPPTVTVKAGQSAATFPVTTNAANLAYGASAVATITAGSAQSQFTVTRVGLTSFAIAPGTLVLGQPATGTVTRATPAPLDTDIPLASNNVRAAVPPTVTIPKGQTSATFPVSSSVLGPDARVVAVITAANLQTRLPLQGFAGVSAGFSFACALKGDGTVVCWGDNASGELNVPAGLSGVVQVSAGNRFACALKGDGSVVCWGSPLYVPPGVSGLIQVSAGFTNACGLKGDGSVVCWGDYSPPPPALSSATQVSAGLGACALKGDGSVVCWNDDYLPKVPARLSGVTQVSVSFQNACALKEDGTVVCWGRNDFDDVPAGLSGVTQVSIGLNSVCALKGDGTVVCWGDNSDGELNVPAGLSGVVQVSVGYQGACAVKNDGTVVCWGQGIFTPPTGLNLLQP